MRKAVFLLLLCVIGNAGATTFYYSGQIYSVTDNSADSSIVEGTTFSGAINFDSSLTDMSPENWYGDYYPTNPVINSISASLGNTNISKELNRIVVYDDKETCYGDPDCHYLDRFFLNAGDNILPDYDYIQIWFDEQSFGYPTPTLLSSDSLPINPLDLDLTYAYDDI